MASDRPEPTLATAWPVAALRAELAPLRADLAVEVLAEADSTNTRLLERARAGNLSPCLLVCERQTAGRGRLGRSWFSDVPLADSGPPQLCFSLGLVLAPADWSGLSLAVGVALAEALQPHTRLKWPNDLWLMDGRAGGRKLGGVLIETLPAPSGGPSTRYAVIGVGLNLAPPVHRPGLDQPAAGWREREPAARAPELLARLAAPLAGAVDTFEAHGFAAFAARFAALDALAGHELQTHGAAAMRGRADGVDASGALRLLTPNGLRLLNSGEVSVRRC